MQAEHGLLSSSSQLPVVAALLLLLLILSADGHGPIRSVEPSSRDRRGVSAGVSEKSNGPPSSSLKPRGGADAGDEPYPWTNAMLAWQRTSFHFQPPKNWMNDPDAPLYYKGWYHLFYQYNPDSAVWGNITWGHAVSHDLVRWRHLPLALLPDRWYDSNGVWTGSATLLPSSSLDRDDQQRVVILYTGSTNDSTQVQNLAVPADPSDPLLLNWVKSDANPVMLPPPGIGPRDFRDPSTAWYVESASAWRLAIGSKNDSGGAHAGIALVYETRDFVNYRLLPGALHRVAGTGMWECIDFFPLPTTTTTTPTRYVMKASLDDLKHDYYGVGVYDAGKNVWVADGEEVEVGVGPRVDYGKYYASKTFYDEAKGRRVVFGWSGEVDSERTDLVKGWASVQTIPRTVVFDDKTGRNLLQWPVMEVETLRLRRHQFSNVSLAPGSVLPLSVPQPAQLDIIAEFKIEPSALSEADVGYNCSTSGGTAGRGALGPFGLLVLTDEGLTEQTAVYFYVARGTEGGLQTFFCQDELRSSQANDIVKRVHGSAVPVLEGETLSVRILVDHSIVESFAQGGRTCITSRVYPTKAIYGAARLFLFNNATGAQVTATSVEVWEMNSAFIRPLFEEQAQA